MSNIKTGATIVHGDDKYVIGDEFGKGGFGKVFHAVHLRSERPPVAVVVKVPHPDVMADKVLAQKFAREARILANISHRNVVTIIDYLPFEDGEKAIVQEKVLDGRPLHQYVAEKPEDAASLLLQALYGMSAFHFGSTPAIVHRDITPNNLLVASDGVLKVIDFGLAVEDPRATTVLTKIGIGMGTTGCIAPEQMKDAANVDHRADLYGLGRAFAAAVQGRDPQHVDCNKLKDPWRSICTNLTEHEVHERYQDSGYATSQAMLLFAKAYTPIARFDLHVAEMSGKGAVEGWAELCAIHFGATPTGEAQLELLIELDEEVVSSPAFAIQDFFEFMDGSERIDEISRGLTSFASADPLGAFYSKIYPHLAAEPKERCLRRLVRTAVTQHRYSVMSKVRSVFEREADETVKTRLAEILEEEDDLRIIEGRGVIPGR